MNQKKIVSFARRHGNVERSGFHSIEGWSIYRRNSKWRLFYRGRHMKSWPTKGEQKGTPRYRDLMPLAGHLGCFVKLSANRTTYLISRRAVILRHSSGLSETRFANSR